jgi:chemotaxis family two-component system response regulator Rcp1
MVTTTEKAMDVLLVEDNPGDIRLTREALRDAHIWTNLHVAKDGEEAMSFLKNNAGQRPDLVILDLNLPRKDGREVLAEIKRDPSLRRIPVVVLTTSKAETDVMAAYDLHANCFITKAVDWERSQQVIRSIESFWLQTATLPPNHV